MHAALTEFADVVSNDRRAMEDELRETSPVYRVLVDEMSRVYGEEKTEGGLDQVHKILIAVAMAVHTGSKSSVEWTVTRAVNHGATDQMVRDAIDVALLNGGTFAVSNARFAIAALNHRRINVRKSK